MSDRTTTERICPQCGLKTTELTCPQHGIPTLARITGAVDTVQTGEIIGGRYRVDKLLGKGGFGAVFRATHIVTHQELVLKVLKPNLSDDETQVKRFLQEARTASKLSHPNTVRVYDFGQTDAGHLYLAMELLHGQELGQVLIDNAMLPPERAIHIAIGVLKSLAEAHQAGLVHRDLKPDNIFLCNVLGEDDFVKVIDFGIAKPIEQGDDGGLTRTGFTVGTPKYMSPEQVLNKGVEGRSDLYALGVILYQCLSGELPLSGQSPVETMMAHVQQEPAPLSLVCAQVLPPGLEAVVMRALRKQPAQRFVDAEDMRAAMEDVQEAAGLTTGRKARSAKLRAVTPTDLDKTMAFAASTGTPEKSAPELVAVRPEPAVVKVEATPHTEDGLDTARLADREPPPAKVTGKQPKPPMHLDATLDLLGPTPVAPVATKPARGMALPVLGGALAALLLAGVGWMALHKPAAAPAMEAAAAPTAEPGAGATAAKLLNTEIVDAAVADLTADVGACHPAGAVDASVLIGADGRSTDVEFRRRSAESTVGACIAKAIRGYRFPTSDAPLRSAQLLFPAPSAVAPTVAPPTVTPAPGEAAEPKKSAAKPRRAAKPAAAKPNGDEAL